MVDDKNQHAAWRINDFNLYGTPTVFFDGGFQVDVGAGSVSGAQSSYTSSINDCGNRTVPDIDVNLSLAWLGLARISVAVTVQNNETSSYQGYLRVYVTETVSSMGWNDSQGNPYSFTFLDYAFDESVYVEAGGNWRDSTVWNGYYHFDGVGHNFGSITPENITVIAAVFDTTWHQGYAYPPSTNPFDAYYVDEATAVWINFPPNTPAVLQPADSATLVNTNASLSWTGGDPNYFDRITYDVYFDTASPPQLANSQTATSYNPGTMEYGTTYYWQIVASDADTSITSPVWSFTTISLGDCTRDGQVNISDVIYLVNYLFKYGPTPNPIEIGDVDCSGSLTVSDVIYLINYFYKGGPAPGC